MDGLTGLRIAFTLCALGAAGGLGLAVLQRAGTGRRFSGLGRAHGMTGLAGMALLFATNLAAGAALPAAAWQGLIVLVLGALGGLVLLRTLHTTRPPLWLTLGHGAVGIFGLWLLWPLVRG